MYIIKICMFIKSLLKHYIYIQYLTEVSTPLTFL